MTRPNVLLAATVVLCSVLAARSVHAQSTPFATGSYIIPMDTDYQDNGMLRAYGLLYRLLRAGVTVSWVIEPTKAHGGTDFTVSARDHRVPSTLIPSHGYRGGPFVIDAADVPAALSIVNAWQALYPQVAVHETTAPFSGYVARRLAAAPTIAVFADGNETIAFGYLNAAGIPDSADRAWPTARSSACAYTGRPDIMCMAMVAGTYASPNDGTLFDATGTPTYCQMMSMHWGVATARTTQGEEVVREYRSFLGHATHLFAECQAVNAIENSVNGHFLTSGGYAIGGRPSSYTYFYDDLPFAQIDGAFQSVGGSEPSYSLAPGSTYLATDSVMITASDSPIGTRDVWMTGYIDGACPLHDDCAGGQGKVSYLGGHSYSTRLPVSTNPETNGTRLFLNALFEADCARDDGQPNMYVAKSAPAIATSSTVTFTLDWGNNGPTPALRATLRDRLPAGATFVSATGGGTFDGTFVTWNLGNVGAHQSGSVTFTVTLGAAAHYPNQASLSYFAGTTPRSTTSNTTDTAFGLDQDGDGILDADELTMSLDPYDSDTDDDGVSDGDEMRLYGTNPRSADTDGDGLADGTELGFVRNCASSCHAPPRCASAGTDSSFVPDTDCTTTTNPLDPRDPARCSDGACNGVETCLTCVSDCGVCPPPPPTCPDGTCNAAETCTTCAADCGACPPMCGDGTCNGTETCSTCTSDCGACPPACGDGSCNGTETCSTCAGDCGACPPACGDGSCNGTETCRTCTGDCGACPIVCGDGTCSATESCSSCASDCGACPAVCGDGMCNGTETCSTCASDCGACPSVCGDGACTGTETCTTCLGDCGACTTCGNGVCEASEDCSTCDVDCGECSTCGDAVCDSTETCVSCAADCGACSSGCRDGVCGATEDCMSCAADCGTCAAACGNGVCEPGETCAACRVDCGSCSSTCGDSMCDPTESCSTCPLDCGMCSVCGDGTCDASESCGSCADDCECVDAGGGADGGSGDGDASSGDGDASSGDGDASSGDGDGGSGDGDGGARLDGGVGAGDGGAGRDGGMAADGSNLGADSGGGTPPDLSTAGGCGCSVPRSGAPSPVAGLGLLFAAVALRRTRRRAART